MKCKKCGHVQKGRLIMEPVYPPSAKFMPLEEMNEAVESVVYQRWACEECRRYHFPDGTLYTNPFTDKGDANSS